MESTSHKSQRSLHGKHVAQSTRDLFSPNFISNSLFSGWLLFHLPAIILRVFLAFLPTSISNCLLCLKKRQTNPFGDKERARLSLFRPAGYVVRWLKRLQGHRFGARRYPCGTWNRLHYSNKPSYTPDRSGMSDSFYIVGHIQPISTVSGPDRRNFLLCQCKDISTVNRWKKKRCN